MHIGTIRTEEARVFDQDEGFHQFHDEDGNAYGSFEVFWTGDNPDAGLSPGWYWWPCQPGCLPDTLNDPAGPFASSTRARYDADEYL